MEDAKLIMLYSRRRLKLQTIHRQTRTRTLTTNTDAHMQKGAATAKRGKAESLGELMSHLLSLSFFFFKSWFNPHTFFFFSVAILLPSCSAGQRESFSLQKHWCPIYLSVWKWKRNVKNMQMQVIKKNLLSENRCSRRLPKSQQNNLPHDWWVTSMTDNTGISNACARYQRLA